MSVPGHMFLTGSQDLLLAAMAPVEGRLSADEQHRNSRTVACEYHYEASVSVVFKAPFPTLVDISPDHVVSVTLTSPHSKPGRQHIRPAILEGMALHRPCLETPGQRVAVAQDGFHALVFRARGGPPSPQGGG